MATRTPARHEIAADDNSTSDRAFDCSDQRLLGQGQRGPEAGQDNPALSARRDLHPGGRRSRHGRSAGREGSRPVRRARQAVRATALSVSKAAAEANQEDSPVLDLDFQPFEQSQLPESDEVPAEEA